MIRVHKLDENGFIVDTLVVSSIDFMPNLVNADIGGGIGDSIINGVLIPAPKPDPQQLNGI